MRFLISRIINEENEIDFRFGLDKYMNNLELYKKLNFTDEVIEKLLLYGQSRKKDIPCELAQRLMVREQWDDAVKELQVYLGDDPDGMKILWEQLNVVSSYTYDEYIRLGISEEIFIDTMKFCTRFLNEHYNQWGTYKYVWAWWFPRQMSVKEFRIGALEYEFVEEKEKEIAVHIPSDADMCVEAVKESLTEFYKFRNQYFPEWENVKLTCDSWMIMPELENFLGEKSNIVQFQRLFNIEKIDREATWYMGWIYPGYEIVDDKLPENTTLQRELKKFLLAGNRFGIAKGYIKDCRIGS